MLYKGALIKKGRKATRRIIYKWFSNVHMKRMENNVGQYENNAKIIMAT